MLNRNRMSLRAALVMSSLVAGCFASGQTSDLRVDLNLKKADLVDAVRGLAVQTGLKFVFEPNSDSFAKITLKLDQVSPDDAIRCLCQGAGADVRFDNGIYLIGKAKERKPIGDRSPELAPLPEQGEKGMVLKRIVMRSADPYDVLIRIAGGQPDPMATWKKMFNFADRKMYSGNSFNTGEGVNTAVRPQITGKVSVPLNPNETASNLQLPGEGGNQFQGGGFQGGGFQGGGFQGGVQGGQNNGLRPGQGLLPEGLNFLTYDPNDNSIVVRGTQAAVDELRTTIAKFDVAPRQVLVKLEFITTSSSLSSSLGYDFNYERGPLLFGAQPGTFARSSDPYFLTYSYGNITTRLRASLTQGTGKTISAPIIRTLNNTPATLTTNIATNYVQTNQTIVNNTVTTTSSPQALNIGTTINVSPRINGDNTITMFLAPTIADQGELRTYPGAGGTTQQIPDILTQTVTVVVRVKSGQTIVMGGLTRRQDNGTEKKYPILGDLPILGQFFRSKVTSKANQELLIFVTPTIVEDEENTGLEPL